VERSLEGVAEEICVCGAEGSMRLPSPRSLDVILQRNCYSKSHGRKLKMACWLLDPRLREVSGIYDTREPHNLKKFDHWLMQIEGLKIKTFGLSLIARTRIERGTPAHLKSLRTTG
jgi:hypothetical protein